MSAHLNLYIIFFTFLRFEFAIWKQMEIVNTNAKHLHAHAHTLPPIIIKSFKLIIIVVAVLRRD